MNIPAIDYIAKLFTFFGLAIILYSFPKLNETLDKKNIVEETRARLSYEVESKRDELKNSLKLLKNKLEENVAERLLLNKMISSKNVDINAYKKKSLINDKNYEEIQLKYSKNTENLESELANLQRKADVEKTFSDWKSIVLDERYDDYFILLLVGVFIAVAGIAKWSLKDSIDDDLKIRDSLSKPTYSKCCQSCGKNFNSIIKYSKDGDAKNYHFCDSCYKDGSFIEPDLNLVELKTRVTSELSKLNLSPRKIKSVISKIEKLERWKINLY